jgi:predicted nuclease with TOPRIM domain
VSLSERLLKYAETVITLSKILEATEEKIAEVRAEVSQLQTLFHRVNERVTGLEKDIEYLKRELDLRDQKIIAELSHQITLLQRKRLPEE